MKSRYAPILLILTVAAFLSVNFLQMTKAENKKSNKTQQNRQTLNFGKTKTINGRQKVVSDAIAYELFFRTVGANNALGLIERAGLKKEKAEKVVVEAQSLNNAYESGEQSKRELRESKSKSASEKLNGFRFVKEQNAANLNHVVADLLPLQLGSDDWKKFQNFIDTEVKPNIQTIPVASLGKNKNSRRDSKTQFIKTSYNRAAQTGDNIHLYSASWTEGNNIFGSGTLSEDNVSYSSYQITTTVTSPSGRTNTTTGDWSYATVENATGLSKSLEDGIYTVQVTFDADAGGYYDEWGNYNSYGTYNVGSATSSLVASPSLEVTQIQPESVTLYSGTTNPSPRPTSQIFQVSVSASSEVAANTKFGIEFIEYRITPADPRPMATRDHISLINQTISGAGEITLVPFTVTANSNSPDGTITYKARIISIDPAIDGVGSSATTVVSIASPTPEPSPSPSPSVSPTPTVTPTPEYGGGGYGGTGCHCNNAGLGCGSNCANYYSYPYNYGCPNSFFSYNGCCCIGSPIILDINGDGYAMTDGANGVSFDINGDDRKDRTSWTSANSDDAWLVLDRNDNHTIDDGKEMFGNYCDQPAPPAGKLRSGFTGLAEFDKPTSGGNGDGRITRADTMFKKLRLWQDKNHNGISEQEELSRLPALDVVAIFLDYKESKRTDEFGNRFKFRAKIRDAKGAKAGRWAWDVFVNPPTH